MVAHVPKELVGQKAVVVGANAEVEKVVVIPAVVALVILAEAGEDPALADDVARRKMPSNTCGAEKLKILGGCRSGRDAGGEAGQDDSRDQCDDPHLVVIVVILSDVTGQFGCRATVAQRIHNLQVS